MRSLPFIVDRVVLRVSAELADNVRDALRASINIDEIIDAFLATFPSDTPTRSQARDWARLNVRQNEKPLGKVLEDLWASGWVLGTDYATEAMRLATIKKAPTFSIDWSKWKPGQPAAEAIVRPPRGLKRLLQRNRNKTIKGISDTNLDRIGTVLADGLAAGADSRSVARQLMELGIKGILDDAKRALAIALTETSRAVGEATVERYQEMGLRRFEWITVEGEGVCEACDENAEAGPIPVGEAFPSGDYHEPAHPNCRCKMAPFIEGFSTPVREDAELGATADVVKYDPDQPRDEMGRFGSNAGFAIGFDSEGTDTGAQFDALQEEQGKYANYIAQRENLANAIIDYQSDFIYQALNDGLRANEELSPELQRTYDTLQEMLLNNEATFSEDLILFRGMYDVGGAFDNVKVGDLLTDNGFVSTTTDAGTAITFAGNMYAEQKDGVEMRIELPAGQFALALDPIAEARYGVGSAQRATEDTDEGPKYLNEVLLPAGTQFEVTSVSEKDTNGIRRIDVRVVGNDNVGG